jgi:hypothetical protein
MVRARGSKERSQNRLVGAGRNQNFFGQDFPSPGSSWISLMTNNTRQYLWGVSTLYGCLGLVLAVSPQTFDGFLSTWGRLARASTPFANYMIQHKAMESLSLASVFYVLSTLPTHKKLLVQTAAIISFVPALCLAHGMIKTDFFNKQTAGLMAAVATAVGATGLRLAANMDS